MCAQEEPKEIDDTLPKCECYERHQSPKAESVPRTRVGKLLLPLGFLIAIILGNINKYIYITYNFEYPLMITTFQFLFSWIACWLYMWLNDDPPADLTWYEILIYVGPVACCAATSICCANVALLYLYPSLYEMMNVVTPLFTILLSMITLGHRYNKIVYVCVIPAAIGLALCVHGEENFDDVKMRGVIASLVALLFRGIKNILQSYLLSEMDLDPIELLSLCAPIGFFVCAAVSNIQEGFAPYRQIFQPAPGLQFILWLSCMCACCYNIIMFVMVQHLSLSVVTKFSAIRTPSLILASLLIFGNSVSIVQLIGFGLMMLGIYVHNKFGYRLDDLSIGEYDDVKTDDVDMEPGVIGNDEEPVYHKHDTKEKLGTKGPAE